MTDNDLIARLRDFATREASAMPPGWPDAHGLYSDAADRIEALVRERDEVYADAKHLAEAVFANGQFDAPHWKPLEDTLGVLTQIDNMVAGIRARAERMEAALREIESITVHSGGEIHGVTADCWKLAFEQAKDEARAALTQKEPTNGE